MFERHTRLTVSASASPSGSAWVLRANGSTVSLSVSSRLTVIRPLASRTQKLEVASSYVRPCSVNTRFSPQVQSGRDYKMQEALFFMFK